MPGRGVIVFVMLVVLIERGNSLCEPKPGTCPMLKMRDCLPEERVCSDDSQCSGVTKCCHKGCVCIEPLPKDGVCPMFKLPPGLPVICNNDFECPGAAEKCCAGGRVCFKP